MNGGQVYIHDKLVNIKDPETAISHSLGLIPKDRKMQGVLLADLGVQKHNFF